MAASSRPLLSIAISHADHLAGARNERLVQLARIVEEAGADQVVLSEHVVLADRIEPHGGIANFPFPPDHNYPEPLVSLAAIAGATQRLRLSTGILIAPLRPAILLAKMAATLDNISGGRLDLGLGAGWHAPELRAAGIAPEHAMRTLEDYVGACRALWAGGAASFRSASVSFEGLHCSPTPLSGAALPIWLAGPPTPKGADRIAQLADGWLPFGNVSADQIAAARALIAEAAARHGRDPAAIGIRASLPIPTRPSAEAMLEGALAAAPAFIAAGATVLQLALPRLARDLDSVGPIVARAVQTLHG
jgi:probable F420-dependent oxidoreductase